MAGGPKTQFSSSSGIFFQGGDGQQLLMNNHSFLKGNLPNSISATVCSSLGGSGADMNRSGTGNSGPSVDASSLVTDANSALSGGPRLQRSASINTESYMRGLPASPLSFSSNTVSMDGSCVVQQTSHQDQSSQQVHQRQQGASSATSQPTSRMGQILGPRFPSSEPNYLSQIQKKPRLDIKQEDVLHPQVMQQMLQRQDPIQLQGHNPQLQQALIQQQRFMHQRQQQQPQQMLHSMPQIQQAHLQQQLRQQQLRQLQQQSLQPVSGMKRPPHENGICARRIMQYIYHHRSHTENTIHYWRRFVAEYYAPRAKKRWCLSLYDNVGQHALGVFPQAAMDAWHCDICGSKSGRGFEATYEVLPRLIKIKFDSGVTDELLFLDMPRECRLPSGIMMLEYGKAIQESVYEQLRVVREGQLRVVFTPDLKILSWEFCARHHEEFLPRRLVVPQVHQLLQVAQKYQKTVTESGAVGVSPEDLQANCNMFVSAGRQLAKNLELQSLNDLGFSKRYIRSLQISEVVNSMKDLIDFSRDKKMGPIESLKSYPGQIAAAKLQIQKAQENEQQGNIHGPPNDRNLLNKVLAMQPGSSSQNMNNINHVGSNPNVSLSTYQNLLRQSTMKSNPNVPQRQEATCAFNSASPGRSLQFQSPSSNPNSCLSSPRQVQQPVNSNQQLQQNNQQSSTQVNQNLQQHVFQQIVHEMVNSNNGGGRLQQPLGEQTANVAVANDAHNAVNDPTGATGGSLPVTAGVNKITNLKPITKLNPKVGANDDFTEKGSDSPTSLHLMELVQDISQEFAGSGLFNSDDGDIYGWKN